MTTAEHPITRSELREELARYPTKAELREELSRYATKADLQEELARYATKADLRAELDRALQNYVTKADLIEGLARYASKAELREELARYATKADLAEVKTEVVELRAELYQSLHMMESRLLRWIAGWTTGGMVGVAGLVLAAVRVAGN